jgi:hypothetical protein
MPLYHIQLEALQDQNNNMDNHVESNLLKILGMQPSNEVL